MTSILPKGRTQFADSNGAPLAGGSVAFYIPGTTTPKDTWQDAGQVALNTNPVLLDSAGSALIYGSGAYRSVVKDAAGNTIYDAVTDSPGTESKIQAGGYLWATGVAGTNTLTATLTPAPTALTAGMVVRFIPANANTGAVTLNLNGLGGIAVRRTISGFPADLTGGELQPGVVAELFYTGVQFQLVLEPGLHILGTATAASSSSINFTNANILGNTLFDDFELRFNNLLPATSGVGLWFRVSQGGVFQNGATDYRWERNTLAGGANTAANGTGGSQIVLAGGLSNSAARGAQGIVRFSRTGNAGELKFFRWEVDFFDGTNLNHVTGGGMFQTNSNAIDGVQLFTSAGVLTTGNATLSAIRKL